MYKHGIKRGFTIAELLVVIVILASFALLSSFGYNKLKEHQTNEKSRTNAESVASALDEIYMAGLTSDGATGKKGEYPSIQEACVDEDSVVSQVLSKQKGVDKDTRVAYLSAANPEKFSQDLSGCRVLPSGEISNDCVGGSPYPAKLVTCSSAREELDASQPENIGIIIYQPITSVKISSEQANTNNMSWQCLGAGFQNTTPVSGDDSETNSPTPGGQEEISCRGFYVYYLEKSGGKAKLSKAMTGKY